VLDALLRQAHESAEPPPWTTPHELIVGDLRDGELLDRLLPGVDVVRHRAAMVGHGVDPSDAPAFTSHNDYR
jgi:dTDP-L-rhamnose 4-epimerase